MASTVASRFAVLSVDDEDDFVHRKKKGSKKPIEPKPAATSKSETNMKKKKKPDSQQAQNSKGRSKSNNANNQSKKKKENNDPQQWEEWMQKDSQFVEGNYEEDLSQAILLSKLDYEEKKDFYDAMKKSTEEEKKIISKKSKKSGKYMTLEEFYNLGSNNSRDASPSVSSTDVEFIKEDPEFFERIKEDVRKELDKEEKLSKKRPIDTFDHEAVTLAQYKDALEKKNLENEILRTELSKMKEELIDVKSRNKTLYQILAHGEMKDKAEVLMELEKLQSIREELSNEVVSLHAQLEQERSKVRALSTDHKSKDKNKKRTTSSSDNTQ